MEGSRVLVVEDEGIVAMDLERLLGRLGYVVPAVVADGEGAVAKTEALRPDVVLMDIMLKGQVDGVQAAEAIRERFNTPVVFLTAYGDEATVRRAKAAGPFGYVLKPFEERQLEIAIEMALQRHALEKATTERAQLHVVLLTANAMAHEINNPLQVIKIALEEGLHPVPDRPVAARIAECLRAVGRIADIVSRLYHVTHIESTSTSGGLPPMLDIARSTGLRDAGRAPTAR